MLKAFCDDCDALIINEFQNKNTDVVLRAENMDELIVSLRERMKRKWGNTVQNGYKSGGLHLKKVPPL